MTTQGETRTRGPRHVLSDVDEQQRTGICSVCGPTSLYYRNGGKWKQCGQLRKQNKGTWKPTHEAYRADWLKRRYNITPEQYEAMLVSQGNSCAICAAPEPGGRGAWHVDHDHGCCSERGKSCGQCVRGLLCHGCNTALGAVREDMDTLRKMIGYLSATSNT